MKREHSFFLKDIAEACKHIQEFTKGMDFEAFLKDEKTSSAVIRKIEIIGEAAKNIPESLRKKYSHIPWKQMAGMRDILIHSYFKIDYNLVWGTIETDIPSIISSVSQILDSDLSISEDE